MPSLRAKYTIALPPVGGCLNNDERAKLARAEELTQCTCMGGRYALVMAPFSNANEVMNVVGLVVKLTDTRTQEPERMKSECGNDAPTVSDRVVEFAEERGEDDAAAFCWPVVRRDLRQDRICANNRAQQPP